MTRPRSLLCALSLAAAACGGEGPDIGLTVRGLDSVPRATFVDIQIHPAERTCALLHETFMLGTRPSGVTGTDVAIDDRFLFGSIPSGVFTVTAVPHDAGFLYGDGCKASVEFKTGEVTEINLAIQPYDPPVQSL